MSNFALPRESFPFQSTFPQGERPIIQHHCARSKPFQSTFPQGERREVIRTILRICNVSIHVPARGTTAGSANTLEALESFNPRSRKGNDEYSSAEMEKMEVSIHVPARGTTKTVTRYIIRKQGFNPRSRKGNDMHCAPVGIAYP